MRLLVVVGTKAEEQPGVLNFGGGRVAVVGGAERRDARVDSVHATRRTPTYTRAKDPKWSPVLAAPPANVDLPGGLFRSGAALAHAAVAIAFLIVAAERRQLAAGPRDGHGPNRPQVEHPARPVATRGAMLQLRYEEQGVPKTHR